MYITWMSRLSNSKVWFLSLLDFFTYCYKIIRHFFIFIGYFIDNIYLCMPAVQQQNAVLKLRKLNKLCSTACKNPLFLLLPWQVCFFALLFICYCKSCFNVLFYYYISSQLYRSIISLICYKYFDYLPTLNSLFMLIQV